MARRYETNIDDVDAWLNETISSFGFTSTHEGQALGEVIVDTIVGGISERSAERQCDGAGNPWPKNSPRRQREKAARTGECLTNYDTRQMLSITSLRGKVRISQNLVEIEYGTGEAADVPDRLPARNRINVLGGVASEPITDVDKASFAAQQGRAFFELDDDICDQTFNAFSDALGKHMAGQGR